MEEKRILKSFDLISVYGLLALTGVIIFTVLSNAKTENKLARANYEAHDLASQLLAVSPGARSDDKRMVAASLVGLKNSGIIGMDPWGKPYHYKILYDGKFNLVAIVYSAGPNREFELTEADFSPNSNGEVVARPLKSDDIFAIESSSE